MFMLNMRNLGKVLLILQISHEESHKDRIFLRGSVVR